MLLNKIKTIVSLFALILLMPACVENVTEWELDSTEQVIAEYVASNPDFSEFNKVLDYTKLYRVLGTRGPFTLFLPNNHAMQKFYDENGYNSFMDIGDPEAINNLVYNHLIGNQITTGDVGLGALRDTNALGDYIVTEFYDSITGKPGADIRLNKKAIIVDRDIELSNGYIHVINEVLPIISKTVFELVKENPSYSLFAQGLEVTGLKDTLNQILYEYGEGKFARTRYTILAVADTTFNRYGISTIDDLVAYFTNAPDSVTYIENEFYRYMEYHCLTQTIYLSNLENQLYPILSHDNNVLVEIDTEDYKLNPTKVEINDSTEIEVYTGFNVGESNFPAKNGALHTVNDLLKVQTPDPTRIVFEVTEYEELTRGDYYLNYYYKWSDGQNTFENIKWDGDYLQYYYKPPHAGDITKADCLNMLGFWWIELTTPKIMKGKYKVTGVNWQNRATYTAYVDGEKIGVISQGESMDLGTHEWNETEKHKIKLVALEDCVLFWDTLVFTPVD